MQENDQNQDGELELETTEEEAETTEEEEQPEEDQIDWKKEALKYKAIATRRAKKTTPQKPLSKKEAVEDDEFLSMKRTVTNLALTEKKRQFGYEHGLSPEETDAVFAVKKDPKKEDLENPFIKGGLDALRSKKRIESSTPSSSSSGVKFNGKDFKDLPEADKKANWESHVKSRTQK